MSVEVEVQYDCQSFRCMRICSSFILSMFSSLKNRLFLLGVSHSTSGGREL